jgi:ubiquinone/menaquinone biosynthesis C-methylase UbiE
VETGVVASGRKVFLMHDSRKAREAAFHDFVRAKETLSNPIQRDRYTSNKKFYSVDRASRRMFEQWIRERCYGRRLLDFGCGDGGYALYAATKGAISFGADISSVSVENARAEAKRRGLEHRAFFAVQDIEALSFADESFDVVCESGVLHHVDLDTAFSEMGRILKPDGEIICLEALRHNPLFQWYRRFTPHLRTEFEVEHILGVEDILRARKYFRRIEVHYFHLTVLLAVPFRNLPVFSRLLSCLEVLDSVILSIPGIQKQAWIAVFCLSDKVS